MYKISETQYAIEDGDNISFVRDGGGEIDVLAGSADILQSGDGPEHIIHGETVILFVAHQIPY